jgi:PEGA domain
MNIKLIIVFLALFPAVYGQGAGNSSVDELIRYEVHPSNTILYTYQYSPGTVQGDNENLAQEGIATFYTPYSNWLVGDFDGDGIDELLYYVVKPDSTILYLYQYTPGNNSGDNENLVQEGIARFYVPNTNWLVGDFDGDGVDELLRYVVKPDSTILYLYQYTPGNNSGDNENLVQEGIARFYMPNTDWLVGDLDGDGIDELIRYEVTPSNTVLYLYQYSPGAVQGDNENLAQEGIATFYTRYSDWLVGDLDRTINIDSYAPSRDKVTINEGESVSFEINASNNDNIQLGYNWILDGVESGTGQKFRYVSDYKSAGTHKITGYVNDGKGNVSRSWKVWVKNVNRKPEVSITSPVAGDVLAGVSIIKWSALDPDGGELKVTIMVSPADSQAWDLIADGVANDGEQGFDTSNLTGEYKIKVVAKDKEGASGEAVSDSFTIDNDPPENVTSQGASERHRTKGAYVSINSRPSGAMIFIDGKDSGETNKDVEISPGTHRVKLLKDGYLPWDGSITVEKGEAGKINAWLIPMIFGMSLVRFLGIVLLVLLIIAAAVILNQKKGLKKQKGPRGPLADEDLEEK